MKLHERRQFLADVGRGMLVASVGASLASDLGLANALGEEANVALNFGALEPLVATMQETPPEKLMPALVEKLQSGTPLRTLVAAAALANARTFGGEDYIGYHSFMALAPAFAMAEELPSQQRPLPVLKVLFRNTNRIQAFGGRAKEVLKPVEAAEISRDAPEGELLRTATRSADMTAAEATFAALVEEPGEAFNHLQYALQDEVDVHRIVLAWRSWATLELTGEEHAKSLLRQSVHYCVQAEARMKGRGQSGSGVRTLLPRLLDEHKLVGRAMGTRRGDDEWVLQLSKTIANATRDQAAEAVAAALAEGFSPEDVGEAISLAANELLLRDPGRPKDWASPEKPVGSVHGDSVGVHASDAANAWRNIARVSNQRNQVASLIVGAYHTAGQHGRLNENFYPTAADLEAIRGVDGEKLIAELDAAVRQQDQRRACALAHRAGELKRDSSPVFATLLRYGISEDGALHAEKYYTTVREEFRTTREKFRWRQLAGLARVTASEFGRTAPGYDQVRELLRVS
jgi:hypothetical protein